MAPRELPMETFDTVLVSEVAYYWDWKDLQRFIQWLLAALNPDGRCALVHWTGETDYPLTADQVHDFVTRSTQPFLSVSDSLRTPEYRLDVLSRSRASPMKDGRGGARAEPVRRDVSHPVIEPGECRPVAKQAAPRDKRG
jgi:hypothetical protein